MRKVYKDFCGSCDVTLEVIMDVDGRGTSIKCSACGTNVDRQNTMGALLSPMDEANGILTEC